MTTTSEAVLNALQSRGFKKKGAEWRGCSPFRPNSDSDSFAVKFEDDEHGTFIDFVTYQGGSLYQLAEQLNIPLPEKAQVPTTKRAYTGLADYAQAHGVEADVFAKAGWKETEHIGRPALSFPTRGGVRWRFLDAEKPRYINPQGYESCWYGLDKAISMAKLQSAPLVLCNGEASTVVAQHFNLPACAKTGGETPGLPPILLAELNDKWQGEVILAFDCDPAGRSMAEAVGKQIGARAKVAALPFSKGGDLADLCRLHEREAFAELRKLAYTPPSKPVEPQVSDLDRVLALMKDVRAAVSEYGRSANEKELEETVIAASAELERFALHLSKPTTVSFAEVAQTIEDDFEFALTNDRPTITGLRWGWDSWDWKTRGLQPELYAFIGATGMGKTWAGVATAKNLLRQTEGLIVTTESDRARWLRRLVAAECGIQYAAIETGFIEVARGSQELRKLTAQEVDRVRFAFRTVKALKTQIVDAVSPTPKMLKAAFHKAREEYGAEWLIVDSASRMSGGTASGDVYSETSAIWDGLQELYRTFKIPVIATNQISRSIEDRPKMQKTPRLSDPFGGSKIEHNSGVVIGIYNHHYYVNRGLEDPQMEYEEGTSAFIWLKNRWGESDAGTKTTMQWIHGCGYAERAQATDAQKRSAA